VTSYIEGTPETFCSSVAGLGSLLWLYCILHPKRIRQRTLGNDLVLRGSALFCGFIVYPSYENKLENAGQFSGVAGLGSLLWLYCILHPMRITVDRKRWVML
jgi:hypothetical protein